MFLVNRSLILFSWSAICIALNFGQISQLSFRYFSYQIVSIVTNHYPVRFKPPAVSLCFDILDIIDWNSMVNGSSVKSLLPAILRRQSNEFLSENLRELQDDTRARMTARIINHLNAKDLLSITAGLDEIAEACTVRNTSSITKMLLDQMKMWMDCKEVFEVTEYIKDPYKCLSFDFKGFDKHSDRDFFDYNVNMRYFGLGGLMYYIIINNTHFTNRTDKLMLQFHEIYSLPRSGISRRQYLPLSQSNYMTYQHYTSLRLPAPYTTDCIVYKEFENSGHCFEICTQNGTIKRFNGILASLIVRSNRKGNMISQESMNNKEMDQLIQIEKSCQEKCRRMNCSMDIYVPVKIKSTASNGHPPHNLVYVQPAPTIINDYVPKESLINFLTQVGSTIGFWFALSMLDILNFICRVVKRNQRQLNRKKTVNIKQLDRLEVHWMRCHEEYRNRFHQPIVIRINDVNSIEYRPNSNDVNRSKQ